MPIPNVRAEANARMFLAAYRLHGDVSAAAEAAKIDRSTHYKWLQTSPAYKRAFERCREELGDALEAACLKRAREGVLEPVFYQGIKCGAVRRFPEGTAMTLLRGLKPKVYGSKVEMTGADGGPVQTCIQVRFVDPKPSD